MVWVVVYSRASVSFNALFIFSIVSGFKVPASFSILSSIEIVLIWLHKTADARKFGVQYLRLEVLSLRYPRDYVLDKFEPAFPGRK